MTPEIPPINSDTQAAADAADLSPDPGDELASGSLEGASSDLPPIVGVGASAGGLEALKQLLDALPAEAGFALIIVQHLDPTRQSVLPELLSHHTSMPVLEATDGVRPQRNHVYLTPPGQDLRLKDGVLCLSVASEPRRARSPIDIFFRSLAQTLQHKAIGVVLSGAGVDGTLGLKLIKAEGGLTLAQAPGAAQQDGMPHSAIAAHVVDQVLTADRMPNSLIHYVRHPYVQTAGSDLPKESDEGTHLDSILELLHARSRHDFRSYKPNMLLRRIGRRMTLHHVTDPAAYMELLQKQPEEIQALAKDFLVSVTDFFRDPEAWKVLEEQVIAPLVRDKSSDEPVRVWVPGCATGEEAYSIAILFLEQLNKTGKTCPVAIFATDVDEQALKVGREGVYPTGIGDDVSPALLERYFASTEDGNCYHVSESVRELITFARQDLVSDPPFSQLDLICCRNLLMYLRQEMQERLLAIFHYALHVGGFLFLGTAENAGAQNDLFDSVSRKWRVYRRLGPTQRNRVEFPVLSTQGQRRSGLLSTPSKEPHPEHDLVQQARNCLLHRFAPPAILVDGDGLISHFFGDTARYLEQPAGPPTQELLARIPKHLRPALRDALKRAAQTGETARTQDKTQANRETPSAAIVVSPLIQDAEQTGFLVVFQHPTAGERLPENIAAPGINAEADTTDRQLLEQELSHTKNDLRNTSEQLDSAIEAYKTANEDSLSMNEELHSTNEELETSKEELQSLNEELRTVNQELSTKVEQLERSSNDLTNLLNSTGMPTLCLDSDLQIRWFTPAVTDLFPLKKNDKGRALDDFASILPGARILDHVQWTMHNIQTCEDEVRTARGRWYLQRVAPYRTAEGQVDGAVITYLDITKRKRLEARVAEQQEEERRALGRELHDGLGQHLTSLRLLLSSLQRKLHEEGSKHGDAVGELGEIAETSEQAVRDLVEGMLPLEEGGEGLDQALEKLADRTERHWHVPTHFNRAGAAQLENNLAAANLHRIAEEAVHNAVKHARPRRITIELTGDGPIELSIRDDGNGKDTFEEGRGLGIMRYRASLIGAELRLQAVPDGGTTVKCRLPEATKGRSHEESES